MCLPSAAPPGSPGCYPIRNYNKSRKRNASLHEKERSKSISHARENTISNSELNIPKSVKLQTKPENSFKGKQTCERREKSRIAAKQRRHRENQALVELYLALPIQQNLAADVLKSKCQKMTRSELEDHMQTSDNLLRTGSSFNVTGEVVFAPTYRLAATIFRQHNLSTPVLEKAVIIRIASNALCLYNWLHPSFESNSNMKSQSKSDSSLSSFTSMELSNCCTTPNTSVRTGFTSVSTLTKPILSVHSKSLMAIIVDATENIIVYSPPAYTELIGLSWVTAIGLKLNELVARQTSVGFPSELRSHQYHHHSYNLPDNENVLVAENSVNTNYKQRSSSNRYEFECTGIDQTVSSTHPFKSSQNQQQQVNPVEKRVLSEMIWPSSTSTSDRPVFLSSILPTTTIPTSHTGYLDHLNNETEVGVTRNVEDSTAAVTATGMPSGKCKTDQYAVCWNSSIISLKNQFSTSKNAKTDTFSSAVSTLPLPSSSLPTICKTTDKFSSNQSNGNKIGTDLPTSVYDTDDLHGSTAIKNNSGSDIDSSPCQNQVKKDLNLRIYLIQPISLTKVDGSMNGHFNNANHGMCIANGNCFTNVNNNVSCITGHNNNTSSYDFLLDSSSPELDSDGVHKNNKNLEHINNTSCYTGLSSSFKTYHSVSGLKFMDMDNNFLAASGYTKADLYHKCLFDLIHIDDLAHIAEAMNIATTKENQPVITSFYRIRMKCGSYRWVRMLISCSKGSHHHHSVSSLSKNTGQYDYQNDFNKKLNSCSDCFQSCDICCSKKSTHNTLLSSQLQSYSRSEGLKNPSINGANSTKFISIPQSNFSNSIKNCLSSDLIVCYHQFTHCFRYSDLCDRFSTAEELMPKYGVIRRQKPVSNLNKFEQFSLYNSNSESAFTPPLLTNQESVADLGGMKYDRSEVHLNTSNLVSNSNSYIPSSIFKDTISSCVVQDKIFTKGKEQQMEGLYDCVSYPGYSASSSSEPSQLDASCPLSPWSEVLTLSSVDLLPSHQQGHHAPEETSMCMRVAGNGNKLNKQEVIDASTLLLETKLDDYSLDYESNRSPLSSSSSAVMSASMNTSASLHSSFGRSCDIRKLPMLIDNVYDKSSNSCSKKTITATTTTTNSSMNCMASHKLELSAVKRPFQQIRPNATCYSFEEPIDHRNSFQSNVVDYCHTANFSDHDPYCLNAHCYCRSCDYSDSNLLMRDPDPESNLSNMDNFGYREDDYNYSPLLPQAQICPVYNGVVYKEPENVYSAPLKKPRLCPLTKTVTESYDNITFPTDCSYLNGFQFNNSVNSRCGAPYSYMFCEPSSLDDTNKCIRCIDRGTSNYQFNHYLPYHGQRQQHHTFGGFLNRTVIY